MITKFKRKISKERIFKVGTSQYHATDAEYSQRYFDWRHSVVVKNYRDEWITKLNGCKSDMEYLYGRFKQAVSLLEAENKRLAFSNGLGFKEVKAHEKYKSYDDMYRWWKEWHVKLQKEYGEIFQAINAKYKRKHEKLLKAENRRNHIRLMLQVNSPKTVKRLSTYLRYEAEKAQEYAKEKHAIFDNFNSGKCNEKYPKVMANYQVWEDRVAFYQRALPRILEESPESFILNCS